MDIYYLYIKQHTVTGLKYLGYTKSQDPHAYPGSGTRWRRHLNKHGAAYTTEIVGQFTDKQVAKELAIQLSEKYDVVKSKEWANLKIEQLDGGWDHVNGEAKAVYTAKAQKTVANYPPEKKAAMGKARSRPGEKNGMYGRSRPGELNPRWGAEVTEETRQRISNANRGRKHSAEMREQIKEKRQPGARKRRAIKAALGIEKQPYVGKYERPIMKGAKWWHNVEGQEARAHDCPGDGWLRGRSPSAKQAVVTSSTRVSRYWWTTGIIDKQFPVDQPPGGGWSRGRAKLTWDLVSTINITPKETAGD